MNKLWSLKKICACLAAIAITIGFCGSSLRYTPATADSELYYEGSDQTVDSSAVSDNSTTESTADDTAEQSSTGFDITSYATRLQEIAEEQQKIDDEMSQNQSDIDDQKKKQKSIQKKIDSINEKIDVLNSYMTALEIQINTNKREISAKKQEIVDGVDGFKKRLRAMYIAGSDSYTTMILESNSFYDVLMRLELVKRVANHDNSMIDDLITLKEQYESKQAELDDKQAEYEKQSDDYDNQKAELDKLLESSDDAKKELETKQKELEKQNKAYDEEKSQFESDLSGILKSSSGSSARDDEVAATMVLADAKLEELHTAIKERTDADEELGEYDASYNFAWPVPGNYNVSSGVGARWGAYHSGLDITGAHGTSICASDSGTVLRINTTCTHDYGKTESCGCGGGYGNYIIIDHGNDFITLYGHLSEVDVEVGDQVKQGDIIGKMGSTGYSTGDHLHFEIRYQGYILNPAYYVNVN